MESATRICPMLLFRPGTFLFRQLQLKRLVAYMWSNKNGDNLINRVTLLKPVGPSASFSLFSLTVTATCLPIRNLHWYYLKIWEDLHQIGVSNQHLGLSTVLQSIQDKLTEAKWHLSAFTESSGCGKGSTNHTTFSKKKSTWENMKVHIWVHVFQTDALYHQTRCQYKNRGEACGRQDRLAKVQNKHQSGFEIW